MDKVKIYVKGRKNKVTNIKINTTQDLKDVLLLAKSENFRADRLKDLDYDEMKLVFVLNGEKIPLQKFIAMAEDALASSEKSSKKKKNKDGKKKGKKKDKKKDSYNDTSKKKKKKKGKKKNKKNSSDIYIEDGYVHMTRIQ